MRLADGVAQKAVAPLTGSVISAAALSSLSRREKHLKSIGRRIAHDVSEPMVTTFLRHRVRSLSSRPDPLRPSFAPEHSARPEIAFDG